MKSKSGITLMETLISIIIVGIIGTCLLLILANKSRIDKRTIANYNLGERIHSDFEMFTYDPKGLQTYYGLSSNAEKTIYFDSKFESITNKVTENYLIIKFTDKADNGGYYKLMMKVYFDNTLRKFGDDEWLERSIYEA